MRDRFPVPRHPIVSAFAGCCAREPVGHFSTLHVHVRPTRNIFGRCVEFLLLRNCGLGTLAVTVCPLSRGRTTRSRGKVGVATALSCASSGRGPANDAISAARAPRRYEPSKNAGPPGIGTQSFAADVVLALDGRYVAFCCRFRFFHLTFWLRR